MENEVKNNKKNNKKNIKPSDMKANIYDSVEIIVDIHGITEADIKSVLYKLNRILSADTYSRTDDLLNAEEINAYGDRQDIPLSISARKKYLDTENVTRYYSKDQSEIITISRLFISIFLSYEIAHDLISNIKLMNEIIKTFNNLEYFEVERIYLVKKGSIYCSSLYRMYQCFEKTMFGDIEYQLSREKNDTTSGVTRVYNNFVYNNIEVILDKRIMMGYFEGLGDKVYEGKLDTTVSKEALGDSINIEDVLIELNKISFELFICHITDAFVKDLKVGKSNKVRKGLNCYE